MEYKLPYQYGFSRLLDFRNWLDFHPAIFISVAIRHQSSCSVPVYNSILGPSGIFVT